MAKPAKSDIELIVIWCEAYYNLLYQLPAFFKSARAKSGQPKPDGGAISSALSANSYWIENVLSLAPGSLVRANSRRTSIGSRASWNNRFMAFMAQAPEIGKILVKNNLITQPKFDQFLVAINAIYIKSIQPYL